MAKTKKSKVKEVPKEETPEVIEEPKEEVVEEAPVEEPKVIIPKEPVEEPAPEPEPEPEPEEEHKEEEVTEEEPKEEEKPDLKQKLSASARENQKIYNKNRILNQAISEEVLEPTEEEMVKEFPDWEVMGETERTLAKKSVIHDRWTAKIKEASDQVKKIEKWDEEVDKFADDPKTLIDNPELEGKTDDFKEFAKQETSNSVPFKILIGAFLHEKTQKSVPNKGKMFDTESGGANSKGKQGPAKLTVEEGRKLRESDYGKWKEMLLAGRIESGIEE
jgi:hypothetical protein